jgi:hypothetical protein
MEALPSLYHNDRFCKILVNSRVNLLKAILIHSFVNVWDFELLHPKFFQLLSCSGYPSISVRVTGIRLLEPTPALSKRFAVSCEKRWRGKPPRFSLTIRRVPNPWGDNA